MPINAFIGKAKKPSDKDLQKELGSQKALWDELLNELATENGLSTAEWNSYSVKAGWSLRLKQKDRNIVYLSPCHREFLASFALGDKAMEIARKTKFPASVQRLLSEARRYAEGTAVRIQVTKPADLEVVKKMVTIKMAN